MSAVAAQKSIHVDETGWKLRGRWSGPGYFVLRP